MSAGAEPAAVPSSLRADWSGQAAAMGLLVTLVGYASSVAIVVQGLSAVGATQAQITSALVALAVAKGLTAIGLSLVTRLPVSIAWTTPGLALLAATGPVEGGFAAAVGAFVVVGLMIVVAGAWAPLGRLIEAIPKPIANAMLAGILLKLCLAPFAALSQAPVLAGAVLVAWAAVGRFNRLYAVPAAVVVALAGLAWTAPAGGAGPFPWPSLTIVAPTLTASALVSIALPLFLVTMASQNIPGLAVLAANGYRAPAGLSFLVTGAASALAAPFGAPTINLAAITAALCAGPDAHPDPRRRYVAAVVAGVGYMALAGLAGLTAAAILRSPPVLVEAVAGLALIGALGAALRGALEAEAERLPALVTFLVAGSGLSILGIGPAFWGLVLGLALYGLDRWGRSPAA